MCSRFSMSYCESGFLQGGDMFSIASYFPVISLLVMYWISHFKKHIYLHKARLEFMLTYLFFLDSFIFSSHLCHSKWTLGSFIKEKRKMFILANCTVFCSMPFIPEILSVLRPTQFTSAGAVTLFSESFSTPLAIFLM